jgi:hypothetical protein
MNEPDTAPAVTGFGRVAMAVLWPSFLMAGVLTALVFALVDPGDLTWFGAGPIELPRQAVYTLGFLLFWLIISVSAGLSVLMASLPELPADRHPRAWPR